MRPYDRHPNGQFILAVEVKTGQAMSLAKRNEEVAFH